MPTNTFERRIEITDPDALRRLVDIMVSEPPKQPLSKHPYGTAEREQSEELLKKWLSRKKRCGGLQL